MLKRVNLIIRGQVQGVFFRVSARDQALQLNLCGFVRNLEDGSVNTVVEGSETEIERFISWCNHGPETARVNEVIVTNETVTDPEIGFKICS